MKSVKLIKKTEEVYNIWKKIDIYMWLDKLKWGFYLEVKMREFND